MNFLCALGVLGGKSAPGTFDFAAVSVMLESDDLTGRERIPSGKRAEAKEPDRFGGRSYFSFGFGWLVEPLLAGKAYRRQILFGFAEE